MLYVFHQLVRTPGGQRLAEISRGLGLPEVTVLRLLRTLAHEGFVRKDPERGRYRMSPMFWLAAIAGFPDVRDTQRQFLQTLQGLTQQAGAAAVLVVPYVGLRAMGVATTVVPGPDPPPRLANGMNFPMHAIAAGKCYLAALSGDELQEWLHGPLPRVTTRTIVEPQALLQELRQARARGYALDREECLLGVAGVAVPVVDAAGTVAGALQLSCAARELTTERLRRWLPRLQSAARSFSQAFSSLAQLGGA
jgi:DNA-binding IclR family transcriptional regulator